MAKKTDKPEKLTEEQKERLLAAGERLLALNWNPETILEKMAEAETKLRQHVGDPQAAHAAVLAEAGRRIAGVWSAPSFLGRIAELRNQIGNDRSFLDKYAPQAAYLRRTPAAETRLRSNAPQLRQLTEVLRYVPSDVPPAEARRRRAVQRAFAFLLEEDELVRTGLTRSQARTLLAPKYGFREQKRQTKGGTGPRGGNTTVDESVARWLRSQPEARALFKRAMRGRDD